MPRSGKRKAQATLGSAAGQIEVVKAKQSCRCHHAFEKRGLMLALRSGLNRTQRHLGVIDAVGASSRYLPPLNHTGKFNFLAVWSLEVHAPPSHRQWSNIALTFVMFESFLAGHEIKRSERSSIAQPISIMAMIV
jgi:hypothetical protein